MVEITEKAKKELKELLTNNMESPRACLRLKANEEGRLGFGIGYEKPDDEVVRYEGLNLLVVEPELAVGLKNVAINVVESDEGRQFVIINKPQ